MKEPSKTPLAGNRVEQVRKKKGGKTRGRIPGFWEPFGSKSYNKCDRFFFFSQVDNDNKTWAIKQLKQNPNIPKMQIFQNLQKIQVKVQNYNLYKLQNKKLKFLNFSVFSFFFRFIRKCFGFFGVFVKEIAIFNIGFGFCVFNSIY